MNEIIEVMDTNRSKELIVAAEELLLHSSKFQVIVSETEASLAAEYRARVNQQIKDLDAERLDMGAGLRETLLKINTKFNGPIDALKSKLGIVDQALKGYLANQRAMAEAAARAQREQEEIRRREQQAIYDEAEALGLTPEILPAPVVNLPEIPERITGSYGSKVTARDNWKYRLVDIKKVPETFLIPPEERLNKSALNAMARSMKDQAKVKGIEFYNDEILQSRVS